jgi:ribonuclease VapC
VNSTLLLFRAEIEVVPVDLDQAEIARVAWRRFGKGRHATGLNYGDCFAYALAKARGLPLLFQGDDFPRTDIVPVLLSPSPTLRAE